MADLHDLTALEQAAAVRSREVSPVELVEHYLARVDRLSDGVGACVTVTGDRARDAAREAESRLSRDGEELPPLFGVPTAIKDLNLTAGVRTSFGSATTADFVPDVSDEVVLRMEAAGLVSLGKTNTPEFGSPCYTEPDVAPPARTPWDLDRMAGGSSGGAGAAVAAGLVPFAQGSDGGGSIRIPAGYTGLLGFKGTFGRTPRSPNAYMRPHTVVLGNLARSVRDAARYYDVVTGHHAADPTSLPQHPSFEDGLGTHDLAGKRVAVIPALGGVTLEPGVEERSRSEADALIAATGMERVDLDVRPPNLAAQWMMGNLATLLADLGDRWPKCAPELTEEVAIGLRLATSMYNLHTAAAAERMRVEANNEMARAFGEVDFIIATTNPGPAFPAESTTSSPTDSFLEWAQTNDVAKWAFRGVLGGVRVASAFAPGLPDWLLDRAGKTFPDLINMGALTIISNIYGNPAVSIPAGTIDGLPVGMQVLGRHHEDALLFDVALAAERERPWPLVAPRD